MTRLTFTGIRNGREISITWTDGALSGDLFLRTYG
jgi:membrane protease subunit (stomatin/prohibitin family)